MLFSLEKYLKPVTYLDGDEAKALEHGLISAYIMKKGLCNVPERDWAKIRGRGYDASKLAEEAFCRMGAHEALLARDAILDGLSAAPLGHDGGVEKDFHWWKAGTGRSAILRDLGV